MNIENPVLKQIWKDRYKKGDETIEDNLHRVAKYISSNENEEKEFYEIMNKGLFFPAGRTMSNAGIGKELTLNNCFNLNNVPDSISDIFDYIKYGALTQKAGGGTGYNFSLIRPNGTPTSNDAVASGVVSFMDAFDSQTHTILQGGRRGANMSVLLIYHPDIIEYLNSKSYDEGKLVHFNLSIMVDDDFMKAKDNDEEIYLHYPCMTLEGELIKDESQWIIKKKVKARELWDLIMKKAYDTGEYGVFFYENLNKDNNLWYMENITGTNPCLRGDMKLLTDNGYIQISELENKTVNIINKNGDISEGTVWCSGEKEIYKIKFSNKKEIYCTKDHRFMLTNGEECQASDLKNKQIMPYLNKNIITNKEFELYGFVQGDGDLGRLKSDAHLGIEVNIGEKDYDVAEYFMLDVKKKKVYLVGFKERLLELGFSSEQLPNRILPATISSWNKADKASFIRGLYSANGSVLSCGRITFKTTCRQLAEELTQLLKEFNIDSYITTNKAHEVKFSNGNYLCKESYDVNINRFDEKVKFYNTIGFLQKYKMERLEKTLIDNSPYVSSVKSTGEIEKVYDFNEPLTHWGVVEGVIAHNCGEYVSGVIFGENPQTKEKINSMDYMGACNLGSSLLHNFVENPFTKKVNINYTKLKNVIHTAVRMLDNIIDINKFPLKQFESYQKNVRTIGLGFSGLADLLVMFNMIYGEKDAVEFTDGLTNFITKEAYKASIELAKEKGSFPFLDREKFVQSNFIQKHISVDKEWKKIAEDILKYGIRNGRLISIAPTGTISLTFGNNCSSGLEPIFSLSYDRKVKIGGQDDSNIQIVKMQDYTYGEWLKIKDNPECIVTEDKFVTAMNLSVDAHLDMLRAIAFNTDMACSKTINIPTEYSFEDTKKVYDKCYTYGIKGCTIFRPNPIREGILLSSDTKKIDKKEDTIEKLQRGEWKPKAEDTVYHERKVKIGCGKLKLMIGWSDTEKDIQDLYVIRSGNGGCERNLQGMVIAMSGMLRYGGTIDSIEKAFEGVGGCNSFVAERAKGNKLSIGNNCGTAILKEIKMFLKEIDSKDIYSNPIKTNSNEIIKSNKSNEVNNKFTPEELEFKKENGDIAFAMRYSKCPSCGESLQHVGGCISCPNCSFSKCE